MESNAEGTATTTGTPGSGGAVGADAAEDAEVVALDTAKAERVAAEKARKEAELAAQLEAAPILSGADILGADDLLTKWVLVPGWKGKVLIRALSGTERDQFEASIVKVRGKHRETNTENIRAKLCQLSIVDPTDPKKRAPLFTRKQVDALGKKSAADLDIVYTAAAELSGLNDKDVEELAGNSEAGSAGSSSS